MAKAKAKEYRLQTMADIKVFMVFLLDTIRYPIDYTTLRAIIFENTTVLSTEYEECLEQLIDEGHVITDEVDGERYMMVSEGGRRLASVLYDTLDPSFLEQARQCAMKHVILSNRGIRVHASIERDASERYLVTLGSDDRFGQLLRLTLTVNSRAEAEAIKENFETVPDSVYRGILFSVTGKIGYLS